MSSAIALHGAANDFAPRYAQLAEGTLTCDQQCQLNIHSAVNLFDESQLKLHEQKTSVLLVIAIARVSHAYH